jgi:toxin YoeB
VHRRIEVVTWRLVFTRQAQCDARKIARSNLKSQVQRLLDIIRKDPYQSPPPLERPVGDLAGACSRRINIQHRPVHQVLDELKTVKVIRMWTHYE